MLEGGVAWVNRLEGRRALGGVREACGGGGGKGQHAALQNGKKSGAPKPFYATR